MVLDLKAWLTSAAVRTGRWRTQWIVDRAAEKVEGAILVDVHYYEQGNVRLGLPRTEPLLSDIAGSARDKAHRFLSVSSTNERVSIHRLADRDHDLEHRNGISLGAQRRVWRVGRKGFPRVSGVAIPSYIHPRVK